MTTFTLTTNPDNFTGTAGQKNTFNLTPGTLQSTDTITGGATAGFIDVLNVTAGGTITASQFAGVTNVEELDLAAAGSNITLTNGLVAGSSTGQFTIVDGGGSDVVDGSGITNNIQLVFETGAGNDTFRGGNGNDVFLFAPTDLTSGDTIAGGTGVDTLWFTAAGTTTAAAIANVSGIEALVLGGSGNNVTLSNQVVGTSDSGLFVVTSLGGNNTVDASGVTSTNTIIFNAGSGNDTFKGGAGNDAFVFNHVSDLTASDVINGGGGVDTLWLNAGGTVAAGAFANVTNIEALVLSSAGNNVTLTNSMVAGSSNGTFAIGDLNGNDVVDASGITNNTPILFFAAGGNDSFTGGNGGDAFVFHTADLTSGDTLQGGGGVDNLFIVDNGTLASSAFTHVSGIEALVLLGTGNTSVTLTDGAVSGTSIGVFNVADGTGDDVIDASAVASTPIVFFASTGNDTFKGGSGNDGFIISAANLTSADTIVGGAGFDVLSITTNGTVTAANNAGVSQIESVQLLAGGEFDFGNTLSTTTLSGLGTAAVDVLDGSAVTNYALTLIGGGGADTLIGGSKDDTIIIPDANFASIDGKGGNDTLTISGSQHFNLDANASKVHNIEVVNLDDTASTAITLDGVITGADVSAINAGGNTLYIVGSLNDSVTISADWGAVVGQVTGGPTAGTAGILFDHYHDTATNADLFIAHAANTGEQSDQAPTIFLGGTGLPNFSAPTYTTGNAAGVAISASTAVLDDPDTSGLASEIATLKVTISDPHSGSAEFLALNSAGHTLLTSHPELTLTGEDTGTLQISGDAADTVYQSLLQDIVYVNTDVSASLNTADRHIKVDATDGLGLTATERTTTISVSAGNHAPVAVSDSFSVNEDATLVANVLTNDTDADAGDTKTVVNFTANSTTVAAGSTITLANGAVLSVAANGDVTLTQNGVYESLRTGDTAGVDFSYTMQDTAHAQSSTTAHITVNGVNDAPTLDLNGPAAGNDFETTESSGTSVAIASSPVVTDDGNQIKSITLHLSAASGSPELSAGEGFTWSNEASAVSLGIATVTGHGTDTLTITATTSFTAATTQAIISQITHSDPDTTFAFNPADRTITVTLTDVNPNGTPASVTQTTTLDVSADVTDTTNLNSFTGGRHNDIIRGDTGDDTITGGDGADTINGGSGTDTVDYSHDGGSGAVTVNLATGTATDTFGNTDTLISIENAIGTSGADTFTSAASGVNTFTGGAGNDTYNVKAGDIVVEASGGGTDLVQTTDSYTLSANVENLTLQDKTGTHLSDTQTFENFTAGTQISNGQNGWVLLTDPTTRDESVVVGPNGTHEFKMSSDPAVADFAGPYSPALSAAAGEPDTGAAFDGQSIKFDIQAVSGASATDGSRLEIDFGNAAATDRNNFLVVENTANGLRIAVSEPDLSGNFSGDGTDPSPNDWRELTSGVDANTSHTIEMRLDYVDGQNNDVIGVYLDGQLIGETTTFENYHDSLNGAANHIANAIANETDRVFFRPSANGAPQDGPGGNNQGFYIDNLTTSVYNNTSGTGNDEANVITGNSGDNVLTGLEGNDTINGGAGIDTSVYRDAVSNYAISVSTDSHGRVTGFTQVQETNALAPHNDGTDTLTSIERLQFSDVTLDMNDRVQLFDGGGHLIGTFDSIQAAVNAGGDGDKIVLAAGTYNEDVTLDKNIEIDGANSGTAGTGARGAESVIMGQMTVTAVHSASAHVVINGVEIYNTSDAAHAFTGINVTSGADVTVTNSLFFSPSAGQNGVNDRGIQLTTGATGTIDVDHNLFTSSVHNEFSTAAWTSGIWSDGAQTAGTIANNTFEWVRTGINADDFNNTLAIANNTFQNSGTGVSIGVGSSGVSNITSIHDNSFNTVDTDFNLQNVTTPINFDLTATNNTTSGTSTGTVLAGTADDVIKGTAGDDILVGNGGNDFLSGGNGADTIQGGAGIDTVDYSHDGGPGAVTVNLATGTATDTFGNTDTLISIENAIGTSGADTFTSAATGVNTFTGGGGNDTYNVKAGDIVVEASGGGTDLVQTKDSYTLGANVENLTLLDTTGTPSNTQTFDDMGLGPIANGTNGWQIPGYAVDQAVVAGPNGTHEFHISSDPANGAFGGPFSPALSAAAGEPDTGAAYNGQSIKFDIQAVSTSPTDGSRLEIDFGNAAGTDRNNFLVVENTANGLRIAVSEPTADGQDFTGDETDLAPNDWRELTSGVDASTSHTIEMRLDYVDGQNNDVIGVYLDGQLIGETTTFENYHDGLNGAANHIANAVANETDRVIFRESNNGQPEDGAGTGNNQGFYIDNLTTSVYNNTSGTGNTLDNVITGNSGDNLLTGLDGNDTINGGAGIDTSVYRDALANYTVTTTTDSHGRVTGFSQVSETTPGAHNDGTDTLTSIEHLQFSDVTLDVTKDVQLFDHSGKLIGTFDSIQAAINDGADGDKIVLAAGTYAEDVTLDKNIEIDGANSGTAGNGARGAESVIKGQMTVTAAHSASAHVAINGVEIYNTSDNSHSFTGINVTSGADVTVTDSLFYSPVANASNVTADRAIQLTTGATGTIDIDHNLFTGASPNAFSTANWTSGVWSDGAQASGSSIHDNTFDHVRTGINADSFNNGLAIANNTFQNSGTGVSIGVGSSGVSNITSIHDNSFNTVDTDFNLQNVTTPINFDLTATNNTTSGTSTGTVLAGTADDVIKGTAGDDILVGNGGNDFLSGGNGADTIQGGAGIDTVDYSHDGGPGAVTVNLATGTATDTFGNTDTLISIENAIGTSGADTFTSAATGVNTFTGGGGNDTYNVKAGDIVVEASGGGTDLVQTKDSYTLGANVENLTLLDTTGTPSNTQTFDDMGLGPIANGTNGWQIPGYAVDQAVVAGPNGTHEFHISSDPANGAFGGPFSPALSAAAGEPDTGAAYNGQSIKFDIQAVSTSPTDGSRLEIDFGNAAGTDRNNFLVVENTANGLRIAVSEPTADGQDFTGDETDLAPNDWRELTSGVDASTSHTIEMRLDYVDGQNNDVIGVYLDGQLIGETTTFENYHDGLNGAANHIANAVANETDRVIFRESNNGQPEDGAGTGNNQGFYIDNLTTSVYNNTSGTGNTLDNVITGNSGDNLLTGLDGNDTINGGAGIDTSVYRDALANYTVTTTTDSHGRVTGFSQVSETTPGAHNDGTDTLTSIEHLQFSDVTLDVTKDVQLFDHSGKLIGTFDSIQAAINDGADGDKIVLAAGTYAEDVTLDKNIEIDGANSGTAGNGARGAESVIKGQMTVTAAHSASAHVAINGVEIYNTSDNSHSFTGINVTSGADVTVTDSLFYSPVANASNVTADRAIQLTTGATGTIDIDHNLFTGASPNAFSTANWTSGVWSDGAQASGSSIHDNTFDHVRTGINADSFNNGLAIANNTFQNSGTGVSIGVGSSGVSNITSIHDNSFNTVDTDFNLQNVTTPINFDLTATNNTTSGTSTGTVLAGTADDVIKGTAGDDILVGNGGNDTLNGGGGNNALSGGAGIDTAAGYALGATIAIQSGHWVVNHDGKTDVLTGVEEVVIGTTTYMLVDQTGANGGFQHVQDAIDAAPAGSTILIAPGTYSESHTTASGAAGIYINTASLTLQGVDANGAPITSAAVAQASGPTIISAHENDFGANDWIDTGGTNTVIAGVHLQAGPETDNKLLEVWANNVTIQNDFIDVNKGGTTYTGAIAIYFNDNGDPSTDNITSYTVDHNILNEGVLAANGVGDPSQGVSTHQLITNNEFIGTFDPVTGLGRYDTVVINGQVNGIGWLLEPTQTPTISGNTFDNNTTPFLLRGSDNSVANLPNAAEVADILAHNGNANTEYAYALTSGGALDSATRDDGSGPYHSIAVTNTIDTLELALDTTPDNVFGGQRDYIHSGDTLVIQSGATGTENSQIMVEGVNVEGTANSADLNLTLATQFADGSAIANGGVHNVTLVNYAAGHGANIDVTGNALDNVITGNAGNNAIDGAAGFDTVVFSGNSSDYTITNLANHSFTVADSVAGRDGTDTLTSVEALKFADQTVLYVDNSANAHSGAYSTISAALTAANAIASGHVTIEIAAGTYNENVTVSRADTSIVGSGDSTIIHGTFKSDNGISDGGVATFLKSGAGYTQAAGSGVTLNGNDETVSNVKIDGYQYGVSLGDNISGDVLNSVSFTDNLVGIHKGTTADVHDFSFTNSSISDGLIGIDFDKDVTDNTPAHTGNGVADGITIDTVDFSHLVYKGAYFEALSNAHLTNITMDDVGQFGAPTTSNSGNPYSGGDGIDLNLKNGTYSGIEIDNFHLTDTGSSDRDGINATGDKNGGAIVVEARDFGSYLNVPGTVTDSISIHDGTIDGHTSTAIQVGEPNPPAGDGTHGPAVDVTDVDISGAEHDSGHGDVANVTTSTTTVHMLDGGDSLIASPTTIGPMDVFGGNGADTITTGAGNDVIDGGAGSDTIVAGDGNDTIIGTADGVNDSYDGGAGTNTIDYSATTGVISVNLTSGFASGAEIGTDSLFNFQNITGGNGGDSLFGSNANNTITGGTGNDNLVGNGGSDILNGGAGDDTLNGGVNDFMVTPAAANDILTGGPGNDTFKFEGRFGNDTITDWTPNTNGPGVGENIVLVGYAGHTPIIADDGHGNAVITIDDGSVSSTVTVDNTHAAQLHAIVNGSDILIH